MEIRLTTEDTAGASVRFDGIRLKVPGLEGKYDFTGKKEDEGTGLTYFGARFYDPESCRFVTADTYTNLTNDERVLLGTAKIANILENGFNNSQEINEFVYCNNNPLKNSDPDGHEFDAATVTCGVAAAGATLSMATGVGEAALVAVGVVVVGAMVVATIHDAIVNAQHGRNNQRDNGLSDKTNDELDQLYNDPSTSKALKQRIKTEQKARGTRQSRDTKDRKGKDKGTDKGKDKGNNSGNNNSGKGNGGQNSSDNSSSGGED
ncbi:MAG TPA: RHS repeat-associated core domain-containing protein [Bacillota bacterium]|nr:RHS repeat-associated core domain-containing protein [Bacillota bacterium]